MNKTPFRLGALVLLLLVGCAASGAMLATVQPGFPKLAADHGRIYFYRTYSAFGAAVTARILIDRVMVGRSRPGGVFYVDVSEGRHSIQIANVTFGPANTRSVHITGGQVMYVRTWIGASNFGGVTNVQIEPPEQASQIVRDLAYTGGETAKPEPPPSQY